MALAALELTIINNSQILVVWMLLDRDDGFVPSRAERLHAVVLQFDL